MVPISGKPILLRHGVRANCTQAIAISQLIQRKLGLLPQKKQIQGPDGTSIEVGLAPDEFIPRYISGVVIFWNGLAKRIQAEIDPASLKNFKKSGDKSLFHAWMNKHCKELLRLKDLDLSFHHLTYLPPEIGKLTSLKLLHLSDNQLAALPIEIGNLTQLTSLKLINNQLTQLPPEIGNLTQ